MFTKKQTTQNILKYLTLSIIILGLILFIWSQVDYYKSHEEEQFNNGISRSDSEGQQAFPELHIQRNPMGSMNMLTSVLGSMGSHKSTSAKVKHFISSLTFVLFFFIVLLAIYYSAVSNLQ